MVILPFWLIGNLGKLNTYFSLDLQLLRQVQKSVDHFLNGKIFFCLFPAGFPHF